jgi:hypothetical protein
MYDITEKTRNAYEKFVSLSLYSPLAFGRT